MKEAAAIGIGVGVLLVGGVAIAISRSSGAAAGASSSSTSAGAAAPSSSSSMPQGLTSSAKTATGWEMTIAIPPNNVSGLAFQGFYGDVIRVKLPAGCHWRTAVGAGNSPLPGPPTGSDDFVFPFVVAMSYELAYIDDARADQDFVFYLTFGGIFEATSHLATGDYVILAVTQKDLEQVIATITNLYSNLSAANAEPVYGQEAAAVVAAANAFGQKNVTAPLLLEYLMIMGPWAQSFAPDVHSFAPFDVGASIPTWWPSDDTAASSEYHVLYRYVGPGIDVSALPFPCKAWKRVL